MKIKGSVRGTKALNSALNRFGRGAPKALARELYTEANEIMADADEIVPVGDTGNLRASGRVDQPRVSSVGASVIMGFGGPAAPYALYVHEMIGANFRRPGAQAKFLEKPARAALRGMAGRIAARIRRNYPLNLGGKGARNRYRS